jgi:hypothetical protein
MSDLDAVINALWPPGKGRDAARDAMEGFLARNDDGRDGSHRVALAVLKISEGHGVKLNDAIRLAELDWRDVLMAAGFGEDLQAHTAWARSPASKQS